MDSDISKIILFDGVCNLCNAAVQFVLKADKNKIFAFASLQSDSAAKLNTKYVLNFKENDFDTFFYLDGDKTYNRSSAVLHVAKDLGRFYSIFYIFIIIPEPIRDFFYNLMARNRYKLFGKKESCMIPTPELQKRFLP